MNVIKVIIECVSSWLGNDVSFVADVIRRLGALSHTPGMDCRRAPHNNYLSTHLSFFGNIFCKICLTNECRFDYVGGGWMSDGDATRHSPN